MRSTSPGRILLWCSWVCRVCSTSLSPCVKSPSLDAAGTEQTHPGASYTQPNHLLPTYKLHVCHHWGWCVWLGFLSGHHPCGHSAACPLRRECVSMCTCMLSPPCVCRSDLCVPTWPSASCCPRKSFEPSPGKPLGKGSGRLLGMCVQSCQMDLCPSRLYLAPGPWQKIRTESFYKGAADSVQSPANPLLK